MGIMGVLIRDCIGIILRNTHIVSGAGKRRQNRVEGLGLRVYSFLFFFFIRERFR